MLEILVCVFVVYNVFFYIMQMKIAVNSLKILFFDFRSLF